MYQPKFSITNPILKYIGQIEGAKEVVDYAVMVPAWEVKFQEEARVRTVHFGTRIEGNELNYSQAERVMAGEEVIARERDVQEVINTGMWWNILISWGKDITWKGREAGRFTANRG